MHIQKNIQASVSPYSKKCIVKDAPSDTMTHFNWFARFENDEYRTMKHHALYGLALVENK